MDWIDTINQVGVPVTMLAVFLLAGWWVLRQTLGKEGWLKLLAAKLVERLIAFFARMDELLGRLVRMEERQTDATTVLHSQHDTICEAGLHFCDLTEKICQKLEVDVDKELEAVRTALRNAQENGA
ncbi:MAG TPA: hypothetical protein VNA25_22910 [Phycisphaerae bacterium]|nr:hypothetical protein [Phycisphaerae bacterium]